jgi:hypothetical protein
MSMIFLLITLIFLISIFVFLLSKIVNHTKPLAITNQINTQETVTAENHDWYYEKPESIFLHDDDYCMRVFVPIENLEKIRSEMDNHKVQAEKNFDGYGFIDVTLIEEDELKTISKKIVPTEFAKELENMGMLSIDKIRGSTLYHNDVPYEDTSAYWINGLEIYFDYVKNKNIVNSIYYIEHIWIDRCYCKEEENYKKINKILNRIGIKYNLILADYFWNTVVDLSDSDSIARYLQSLNTNE